MERRDIKGGKKAFYRLEEERRCSVVFERELLNVE
jgi:hypothetical protein